MSQERNAIGLWYAQKTASESPSNVVGTLNAHTQELKFRRGESFDIAITLTSQRAMDRIRFTVRLGSGATTSGDEDLDYLIRKTSYTGDVVVGRGAIQVKVGREDTISHPYGSGYAWKADVTSGLELLGSHRGRIAEGSSVIYGLELSQAAKVGQVVDVDGQRGVITNVEGAIVVTDRAWSKFRGGVELWSAEAAVIAGGPWTCLP